MLTLEVMSDDHIVKAPLIVNDPDQLKSHLAETVSLGMRGNFDDIALMPYLPKQSETKPVRLIPSYHLMVKRMVESAKRYIRDITVINQNYVAVPANGFSTLLIDGNENINCYELTRCHSINSIRVNSLHAVCFDGSSMIQALRDYLVRPLELTLYGETGQPTVSAYRLKDIGNFLLASTS